MNGPTLQQLADNAKPGDTFVVAPGNYAGFQLTTSGTPAQRITFLGLPGAIINQSAPVGGGDGINLEGASYVTIEGFDVIKAVRAGIRSVMNRGVVIRRVSCDQCGSWGAFTSRSDFVVIEDGRFSNSIGEHGIYVSHATQSPIVRGNECWGNNINGIHLNSGADRPDGTHELITGALIERNRIHDNGKGGSGSGLNCDGVLYSTIQDNLLHANHRMGISLYRDNSAIASIGNRVLRNIVMMLGADGKVIPGSEYALNIRDGSINNESSDNVFSSMLLDADCIPGYAGSGNIVCVPTGGTLYLSADSDVTRLDPAGWLKATGEALRGVLTPDQVFESYRRRAG